MRFLRFALLLSFFSQNIKKQNFLRLINIAIFFTIFAISSAIISFIIETKISDKEKELTYLQIEALENGKEIESIEIFLSSYEFSIDNEESTKVFQEFFSTTKVGKVTISQNDFFTPYIYYSLKELKDLFADEEFDMTNEDDPMYEWIFEAIKNKWEDEDVKKFKKALNDFSKSYKRIEILDVDNFEFKKVPSNDKIIKEIINYSKNNLNSKNDEISDNHYDVITFEIASTIFFRQLMKYLKALNSTVRNDINEINNDIISLSKNEKNIILMTFIFQLIIFIIIQFFEISSLTSNLRKKIK
jgi:hypothetical protein